MVKNYGQADRYVHRHLPPPGQWPDLILPAHYSNGIPLNCVKALLDDHLTKGAGSQPALLSENQTWSYAELHERSCRIAHVLSADFGIIPGNRVLIRGTNSPTLAALWLAIQKCGAIAVTTMSLLRAGELATIVDISKPALALSDASIAAELRRAIDSTGVDCKLLTYDDCGGDLFQRMTRRPEHFDNHPTLSDDVSLIGFTSGTTGKPKAAIHFHRDVMTVCETVAAHIIRPVPEDVFIGTSPLAFTFGLGGLVLFPLFGGSASVLNARYTPESLLESIEKHRASVCFTVPAFYQRMVRVGDRRNTASLRMSVCSGEALPLQVRDAWLDMTGLGLTELLGSTEMLHAFVAATGREIRPGYIGKAVPGYHLEIQGEDGHPLPAGEIGRLAVKGPTGCRYLDDPRQSDYVQNGWNITGDACAMEADGYVAYHTRLDDMIISAGYNISGIEVENLLLRHPEVSECAVIGTTDPERGQVVTAYVVPRRNPRSESIYIRELQSFVRAHLAAYKYPRKVELLAELPRNESGKLQRFRLRERSLSGLDR